MGNPMIIGMALGAGAGALTNKDPLKGALMGGALGAAGGSFAGGFGGLPGSTASFVPGSLGQVSQSAAPTLMQRLSAGGSGLMGDVGRLNQLIKENPTTSQIGFGVAKSAFEPEQPMPYAPQGEISRGQIQPMDYMSLLNPQNQSVMRPQPISLLG